MSLLLGLALFAALDGVPSPTASTEPRGSNVSLPAEPNVEDSRVGQAMTLIADGQPGQAMDILDKVIVEYEARHQAKGGTVYYSARSMTEAMFYGTLAMVTNADAEITDRNWGDAYFLKGFALIDVKRPDEAISWFEKAIALSPRNAHFLAERAEWYKTRRDWDRAYQAFESALDAVTFSEPDVLTAEKGRALRGMAFSRVEQGRLDEAERLIKQALEVNPGDTKAASELEYIKAQR